MAHGAIIKRNTSGNCKMSWEQRKQRGRYYYRTRRRNGKIIREYYGNGPAAEKAAAEDARAGVEREAWRQTKLEVANVESAVSVFVQRCEELLEATMLAAGLHNHKGEWRKRRVKRTDP